MRIPGNKIFWKIFLSYWLAMVLIVVATTLVVGILIERDQAEKQHEMLQQIQAQSAVSVFRSGGAKALRYWSVHRHVKNPRSTFLIDSKGNDHLGKTVPREIVSFLEDNDEPKTIVRERHRIAVHPVRADSGERFWYVNIAPRRGPISPRMIRMPPLARYGSLVIAVLISGLISYWLARNITSPISQLRFAAQRIATGDFSSPLNQRVSKRSDELGELSRDFSSMADQIEQLLANQKRLLGDISHELRSPLARLRIGLELARKSSGPAAEEDHNRIEREAERLDSLIAEVLALVRLDSGVELKSEMVDLKELLDSIVQDASYEAEAQNKNVMLLAAGVNVKTLVADPELLGRALENIIRNAVLYTAENTTVEIIVSDNERQFEIVIRDHGPGVPEASLTQLFEPFYRVASARDRHSGGHGLGLAIARHAILAHAGNIVAKNAADGGLLVVITLPKNRDNNQ